MNPWGSNPSSKRRDKLYIIAEILDITRDGTLKTQIMYKANLSFTQLNEYLAFMLRIGLLERVNVNAKDRYKASEKGLDFLQRYHAIDELLEPDGNNNSRNHVKIPPQHLLKKI
jgi:predicted transcriptional regulator